MSKLRKLLKRSESFLSELKEGREVSLTSSELDAIEKEFRDLIRSLTRFEKIARETDEDKVIYGPKTAKWILDVKARFDLDVEEIEEIIRVSRMGAVKAEREKMEIEARKEKEIRDAKRSENERLAREERERVEKREREEKERLNKERIEREAREKENAKRKERRERARKRRASELSKTPSEALSMLRDDLDSNDERESVMKSLLYILNGILDHPEETSWRRLRKSNEKLNRDILRHRGGRIFLLSCGFRERILQLSAREILTREIRAYYEAIAPRELRERGGRVDVEKLATLYERNQSELWRRLSKKYGHGRPKDVDKKFKDGDWYLIMEEPDAESETDRWTAWYDRLKKAQEMLMSEE